MMEGMIEVPLPNPAEPEPKTVSAPPTTPDHPGSQEWKNAGTEGSVPAMVGSFLISFLPGFLRGIHDYAWSQLSPFCAQISPIRY